MKKEFIVTDKDGLHARPASILAQKAMSFANDIFITHKGKKVNLKSIMILLSLGVVEGDKIEIEVVNDDGNILEQLETVLRENNLI